MKPAYVIAMDAHCRFTEFYVTTPSGRLARPRALLPLPADIVGGLTDVLAADHDVGALRALVALVALQRHSLFVNLDLIPGEAALDQGGHEGLWIAEFRLHSTKWDMRFS